MNQRKLESYLLKLRQAEASFPFGEDVKVFKVKSKMFALVSQAATPARVTLKCRPADGEALIASFEGIAPGYYMNKKHWISVTLDADLPKGLIEQLAAASYELVVGSLKASERAALRS